jgi:hypothetical protein
MKVTFYYGIGFANARKEETFDYDDDVTDRELQQDFDDWSANFIDGGFYREGE